MKRSLKMWFSIGGAVLVLAAFLIAGCQRTAERPASSVSSGDVVLPVARVSDATETLEPNASPTVRRFSSAQDVDWYVLRSTGKGTPSLEVTTAVGIDIEFLDANGLGIGKIQIPVKQGGWQETADPVHDNSAFIRVTPLGDDSLGSYSVRLKEAR